MERAYLRISEALVMLSLLVMVVVSFTSTVLRGVPGWGGLFWAEEITRYACIWMVFLASGLTIRYGVHFRVDLLTARLPPAMQTAFSIFAYALMIWFEVTLIWFGSVVTISNIDQQSTSLEFPMAYVYAAIPIGGALMLFETLRHIWRSFFATAEDAEPQSVDRIMVD